MLVSFWDCFGFSTLIWTWSDWREFECLRFVWWAVVVEIYYLIIIYLLHFFSSQAGLKWIKEPLSFSPIFIAPLPPGFARTAKSHPFLEHGTSEKWGFDGTFIEDWSRLRSVKPRCGPWCFSGAEKIGISCRSGFRFRRSSSKPKCSTVTVTKRCQKYRAPSATIFVGFGSNASSCFRIFCHIPWQLGGPCSCGIALMTSPVWDDVGDGRCPIWESVQAVSIIYISIQYTTKYSIHTTLYNFNINCV